MKIATTCPQCDGNGWLTTGRPADTSGGSGFHPDVYIPERIRCPARCDAGTLVSFAQRRLLSRLLDAPGSSVSIETIECSNGDPHRGPTFKGRFHLPACPHCRHAPSEPTPWMPIFALAQLGILKETISGSGFYRPADIDPAAAATHKGQKS